MLPSVETWCVIDDEGALESGFPVGSQIDWRDDRWVLVHAPGEPGNMCGSDASDASVDASVDADFDADFDAGVDGGRDAGQPVADADTDGGQPDAGCPSMLGTPDACLACGDVCDWACEPSGCTAAAQVSAGGRHTCSLRASGTVDCWGSNLYGQLGDGSMESRLAPVPVAALVGARRVVAGSFHSCAILSDSTLRCWGLNNRGQLGDGTIMGRPAPVIVRQPAGSPLVGVVDVAVGGTHTCALLTGGAVHCWGQGPWTGTGTMTTDRLRPTEVAFSAGTAAVTAICAGSAHACARRDDGTVWCWGSNMEGQVGDGGLVFPSDAYAPIRVRGTATSYSDFDDVSCRGGHTCARVAGGSVRCWGENGEGQLGNGTTTNSNVPVQVTGLGGVTELTPGTYHMCAILTDGSARCWGWNDFGQIGDRTTVRRTTPVPVDAYAGASVLSAGGSHTCLIDSSGALSCLGGNDVGQLGDGTTLGHDVLMAVSRP